MLSVPQFRVEAAGRFEQLQVGSPFGYQASVKYENFVGIDNSG